MTTAQQCRTGKRLADEYFQHAAECQACEAYELAQVESIRAAALTREGETRDRKAGSSLAGDDLRPKGSNPLGNQLPKDSTGETPRPPDARIAALRDALSELRINANRLCDRQLGGTYEADCRRSLAKADAALTAEHKAALLSASPAERAGCPTSVCEAAASDGIVCAEDACDRALGVRPAERATEGAPSALVTLVRRVQDTAEYFKGSAHGNELLSGFNAIQHSSNTVLYTKAITDLLAFKLPPEGDAEWRVGCEGADWLLRLHSEAATCDVCAPYIGADPPERPAPGEPEMVVSGLGNIAQIVEALRQAGYTVKPVEPSHASRR